MFASDLSPIQLDIYLGRCTLGQRKSNLTVTFVKMIQELVFKIHLFKDLYLLPLGINVDGSNLE